MADQPCDLEAVLARQHDVAEHEVNPADPLDVQCLFARADRQHLEAAICQQPRQEFADGLVVFDEQHDRPGVGFHVRVWATDL